MITEAQRHRLYTTFEEWIGEEANTLMDLLPPVGWADVATKHDLAVLATREDLLATRADLHRELRHAERTMIFAMLAAMATQTGLLVTVITLLR